MGVIMPLLQEERVGARELSNMSNRGSLVEAEATISIPDGSSSMAEKDMYIRLYHNGASVNSTAGQQNRIESSPSNEEYISIQASLPTGAPVAIDKKLCGRAYKAVYHPPVESSVPSSCHQAVTEQDSTTSNNRGEVRPVHVHGSQVVEVSGGDKAILEGLHAPVDHSSSHVDERQGTTANQASTGPLVSASRPQRRGPCCGANVFEVEWWDIPLDHRGQGTTNKEYDYIHSQIQNGTNVGYVRKRRRVDDSPPEDVESVVEATFSSDVDEPKVFDAYFDTRFLRYDESPYGFLDRLVDRVRIGKQQESELFTRPSEMERMYLQRIPDLPVMERLSSRIGPKFQARVPRRLAAYHDKRGAPYLPGRDTLWDPVLAETAEKNGQDITGFLGLNMSLKQREMRMTALHESGYDVKAAKVAYAAMVGTGVLAEEQWSESEVVSFEKYLMESAEAESEFGKSFQDFSRKMGRSRTECLIQYYRWKSRYPRRYHALKKKWKEQTELKSNDHCAICKDGGNLLLCDSCDGAYHPRCLSPPLVNLPSGKWFCPRCILKNDDTDVEGVKISTPQHMPASSPSIMRSSAVRTTTAAGKLAKPVPEGDSPMVHSRISPQFSASGDAGGAKEVSTTWGEMSSSTSSVYNSCMSVMSDVMNV